MHRGHRFPHRISCVLCAFCVFVVNPLSMTDPNAADPTKYRPNIDPDEIARFSAVSARWWERDGAFKGLHDINGLRAGYIAGRTPLQGRRLLDVGCGGGILSEAMAAAGARVTGIDMGGEALAAARAHGRISGLSIDYRQSSAEDFARQHPGRYRIVTCMELLEHVPRPESVIAACARLLDPGGHLFVATLNRTTISFVLAIVAAEYLLGIVPRGTHTWRRFIRPRKELAPWAESAGLTVEDIRGMRYIPFFRYNALCRSTSVNYLAHFRKPETGPSQTRD
jgi:2-polyprenyl-6-hydroxyphenyl methylase / 3-demethylubiquinone-9 3-methyltransferase